MSIVFRMFKCIPEYVHFLGIICAIVRNEVVRFVMTMPISSANARVDVSSGRVDFESLGGGVLVKEVVPESHPCDECGRVLASAQRLFAHKPTGIGAGCRRFSAPTSVRVVKSFLARASEQCIMGSTVPRVAATGWPNIFRS